MIKVKKAYFPFSLILWIFKKMMCSKDSQVAMIDPFLLNIVALDSTSISDSLYKHESCHIMQVKRDGRLKFICKYLYYNIKYGYYNNPYEIEARQASNN